jgi:PAS domain S-box-containing protein
MSEENPRPPAGSKTGSFFRRFASLSLRARFFLGVGVILLCFCSICAYIIYRQGKMLIEEASRAKSQIVMAAVEATQAYVRQVLRPRLYEIMGKDAFVMEAMSTSYVSRAVMDRFGEAMPEYRYRRVNVNARNSNSEANPAEVRMLKYFAANPDKQDWEGILQIDGESQYMRYRPVYYSASCMHCHGKAMDAPKALLEKYGSERGFGHQVGDLAGVVAIGIPLDIALGQLKGKAFAVFMSCLFGAVVLMVLISSFFNRLVAGDLRKILNIFRKELPEEGELSGSPAEARPRDTGLGEVPQSLKWADELKLFEAVQAHDEIEEITIAARTLARRLRENQAKLFQSKELLQSVFDSTIDTVVLMDRDFRIKMVNQAFLNRYQLREEEVTGQLCRDLHAGDLCPLPDCGRQKVLETRKPVIQEMATPAGEIFLMHFYPVLNDRGQIDSVVRYARDITEQRRLEQNIQRTEKLASLGQLAAGVAHEINNPLGVILTYTDLLKKELASRPEPREDVETIEKHTLACKRIVTDLLKFARSESARKQLTSLNRCLEEAVNMLSHQFSHSRVALRLDLDPDLPLINVDADKMKQVFLNLLMNAAQAIGEEGEIRVATSFDEAAGQERVVIRDNGKGIPGDLLEKIFDPFFSTKAAGEGTGLGLSVSYGIIQEHRGEIQVKSEPGQWTEFTITLPVSDLP